MSASRKDPARMRQQAPFRIRLFATLLLFAVVPTVAVSLLWTGTASRALSLMSAGSAWERVARSGELALSAARSTPLSAEQSQALDAHEAELKQSVELAKRFDFVANRTIRVIAVGALLVVVLVAVGASRVAGHLSRQLSRPLDELVGWTRLIRGGRPIPEQAERRGAPEFEVLRTSMRTMAQELDAGRQRALEAERAEAFRESARRFAHELKNPLTPIRFAVERLRRSAPDTLRETVEVLAEESARLDAMARSFAQFGRLPDGPAAEIDVAELVSKCVRNTVPERLSVDLAVADRLPMVVGFHDALSRAVTNVLINAVDACPAEQQLSVRVSGEHDEGGEYVVISVRDTGHGMPPDVLSHMFDPYVTTKPGGTGLGLAIARQTMTAHGGDISASSVPGFGTELRLRLPVTRVENGQ
ncbi:MAG: HAMP domain-containing histidine kinase [Gemmatimonadaceae bacterium]|nr:HAMP domain-containing histidine kinase [Gemmatimonadaceae bacterium]